MVMTRDKQIRKEAIDVFKRILVLASWLFSFSFPRLILFLLLMSCMHTHFHFLPKNLNNSSLLIFNLVIFRQDAMFLTLGLIFHGNVCYLGDIL